MSAPIETTLVAAAPPAEVMAQPELDNPPTPSPSKSWHSSGKLNFSEQQINRVVGSIPKPGDKDNSQQLLHNALVKAAIKLLLNTTEHAYRLHEAIDHEISKITQAEKTEDMWQKEPNYVGALDKGWQAQWIVAQDKVLSPQLPFTREFLDTLESKDPRIISHLFQLFTGTTPYTEIPPECKASRSLTSQVFAARAHEIGSFMKGWRKKYCTQNSIDLKKGGAYELVFDEHAKCTEVKFMGGRCSVAIDPSETIITDQFVMKDPLSVQNCMVYKGINKFRLLDCFGDAPNGPKVMLALNTAGKRQKKANPLQAHATHVASHRAEATQAIVAATFEEHTDFVGIARKKEMAETLKRASARAQESATRRRTLALT